MAGSGSKNTPFIVPVVGHYVRGDDPKTSIRMIPVNSITWAPYDLGPMLACASSDGKISVLSFQSGS